MSENDVNTSYKLIKVSFIITWEDLLQYLVAVCGLCADFGIRHGQKKAKGKVLYLKLTVARTYLYKSMRGCKPGEPVC